MTGKIPEPKFLLQISRTRGEQIVLIYRDSCKGVELGCSSRSKTSLAAQFIPLYLGISLETLWRRQAGGNGAFY